MHFYSAPALRQIVRHLCTKERTALLAIADHLGEIEERRLHLEWGFGSMWEYCERELKLTDAVRYQRITLSRLLRNKPYVRQYIVTGQLGACAACALMDVVEAKDFDEVLQKALGMSKRQLQDFLATRRPGKVPTRDVIRRVAAGTAIVPPIAISVTPTAPSPAVASPLPAAVVTARNASVTTVVPQSPAAQATSSTAAPAPLPTDAKTATLSQPQADASLKAKTHRVSFLATEETAAKLARAKELADGAELDDVVAKALDLYLAKHDPRERAARREARAERKSPAHQPNGASALIPAKAHREPRRPSAALRDAVRLADGERCAYVAPDGTRCGATRHLQNDHVRPFALGGSSSDPANQRTLCRSHNLMLARRTFGAKVPR